jgi:hypothetical protein
VAFAVQRIVVTNNNPRKDMKEKVATQLPNEEAVLMPE